MGRVRAGQSGSRGLSSQAEEVLLPEPLLQGDRPPVTFPARGHPFLCLAGQGEREHKPALLQHRRGHAVPTRGTGLSPPHWCRWHHRDDALGTSPPLQEGEAWSWDLLYAWKYLGGVTFWGEALGLNSLGIHRRDPSQDPTG